MTYSLHVTEPDAAGRQSMRVEFPEWPRVVWGRTSEDAVVERHRVPLPKPSRFYAAGSFIGLDRGDVGEYGVVIGSVDGPELYNRSLHKEVPTSFDSEDWKYANYITSDVLQIWLTARTTGPNEILRPGEPWSSRPHFGVRLWTG